VNPHDAAQSSGVRGLESLPQQALRRVGTHAVEIDSFFGFGLSPCQLTELLIANSAASGQQWLIGIRPAKGVRRGSAPARAIALAFTACPDRTKCLQF
jgi:hypothetical protein